MVRLLRAPNPIAGAAVATAALLATPAAGQLAAGGELTLASRHVWRGTVVAQGPVAFPAVLVTHPFLDGYVAVGAWAGIELTRAGTGDFTLRGAGRRGVGEIDYWGEAGTAFEGGDASLGVTRYTFHGDSARGGRDRRANTSEIYGRLRLTALPFFPEVRTYWDVQRVDGLYFEGAASLPVLGNPQGAPFWAIYLRATAGANLSQHRDTSKPSQLANFSGTGLTHLDLSAAVSLRNPKRRGLASQLELHVQVNRDARTERLRATESPGAHRWLVWGALSASYPSFTGGAH